MADAEEEVRAIAKELARKRATKGSQTVSVGAIRVRAKKAGCRALMHKSNEDVKAWLAARPEDYVLLGGDEVLVVAAVRVSRAGCCDCARARGGVRGEGVLDGMT